MHPLQPEFAAARRSLADQLGSQAARFLVERMAARELAAGQLLLREGATADALYFVLGGTLAVFVGGAGGASHGVRVGAIEPGRWVGEVTFVDPGPASATVVAETPVLVLELRNRDIELLTDDAPEVAAALLTRLCRELAERIVTSGARRPTADDTGPAKTTGWLRRLVGRRP
ncbi:MAG: cyclic nucleotide-binding domain-containing protein [Myxococcales bacterium]|nr:cyclic nucleotide-binding domain-containing protein [Myxococcales bacterium]MCB9521354.1 cyclic nucleotide-binding domain-containing protein [Myxococcales bacterium]